MIVPTYNEKDNLTPLLQQIRRVRTDFGVLFVDDSSPDGTGELIRGAAEAEDWIQLLSRDSKMGIGSAYLRGFEHAVRDLGAEVVAEMDADLQHDPSTLPSLLREVEGGADVAVASRYVPGGGSVGWGRGRRVVSRTANVLARTMLRLKVKDCTSGFRAYRRASASALLDANLPTSGFEFQVAALKVLRSARTVEVPYTFRARTAGESKLRFKDVARFFLYVLRASV